MGEDKALVQFAGRPLVEIALEALRQAGLETRIAGTRSPQLQAFATVVEDSEPGRGPLGGICDALAYISVRWGVFLPVDLPLTPAALIEMMVDHAEITGAAVTVPSVNGFAQTFPAVVDRDALPALRRELDGGHGGCFSAFKAAAASLGTGMTVISVEAMVQVGKLAHPSGLSAGRWFANVNAPGDLRRTEAQAHRVI
jgi:molybdopterin-guanine dinucleotide biosynthesis protein A